MTDGSYFEHEHIVTIRGFPGGVRCGLCDRTMEEGEPYCENLMSFAGDTPVVLIVCTDCDGKPVPEEELELEDPPTGR